MKLSPSALLEFCNKVRLAGGADTLDALQPGIPGVPRECLIARNLNFDCAVKGVCRTGSPDVQRKEDVHLWGMVSHDPQLPAVVEALGLEYYIANSCPEGYIVYEETNEPWIRLPQDLEDAAIAFDQRNYPDELYVGA